MSDHTAIAAIHNTYTKATVSYAFLRMGRIRDLLLIVLLGGCQSTQDVYLAQATDHATAAELEQVLGHPLYEQALDKGQRRWLYRREGHGTGGRDFTPFCQDLWLTFDQDGVLRTWQKQRC
jgi:hypothetical protein